MKNLFWFYFFIKEFQILIFQSILVPFSLKNGKYSLNISLGFPTQDFPIPINLCTQNTIITLSLFQIGKEEISKKPESILSTQYLDSNYSIRGYELNTTFSIFPSVYIKTFPFFYVPTYSFNFNEDLESLAFGYSFSDESNSLVHLLYNMKHISSLSFSFINVDRAQKIILGSVPSNLIKNSNSCVMKVNSINNTWGFNRTGVIIDANYIYK